MQASALRADTSATSKSRNTGLAISNVIIQKISMFTPCRVRTW